jgi:hypothetical protein
MHKIGKNSARAVSAALLVLIAACASSTSGSQPSAMSTVYPEGIMPFKNDSAAVEAGLYPSHGNNCCFLGPRAKLMLKKPAGRLRATFTFYVPDVAPYAAGESVTVTAAGKSATSSTNKGASRWLIVTLSFANQYKAQTALPVEIASSKSFVPSKIGTNGDTRDLSVVLTKVDYP